MAHKLFIGNLSYSVGNDDLAEFFGQAGNVVSANVIMDRDTGRSKGFGFVEFETKEEADKAQAELNGQDLQGRALKVDEAKPRRDDRPRF